MLEPVLLVTKTPRLIHGKAEKIADYGIAPDIIVTSPPYNLDGSKGPAWGRDIEYTDHDDNMPEEDYQFWQRQVLDSLYVCAKDGASLFYNHKVRQRDGEAIFPHHWICGTGWTIRQEIIWDRGSTHNHHSGYFWPEEERIFWMTKGKPNLISEPIGISTIWKISFATKSWHPAPFPITIPLRAIRAIGKPGDVVLDPFCGSGTTLSAASMYGLDSVGIDSSMEYLETAKRTHGWASEIEEKE